MGTLAAAGTSNSKTATEPPDASPSSRNRIAIPPILISSLGLASMSILSPLLCDPRRVAHEPTLSRGLGERKGRYERPAEGSRGGTGFREPYLWAHRAGSRNAPFTTRCLTGVLAPSTGRCPASALRAARRSLDILVICGHRIGGSYPPGQREEGGEAMSEAKKGLARRSW